jgi:hypothetical protein
MKYKTQLRRIPHSCTFMCVSTVSDHISTYTFSSALSKRPSKQAHTVGISTYRAWTRTHSCPRYKTLPTVILATKCRLDATYRT